MLSPVSQLGRFYILSREYFERQIIFESGRRAAIRDGYPTEALIIPKDLGFDIQIIPAIFQDSVITSGYGK